MQAPVGSDPGCTPSAQIEDVREASPASEAQELGPAASNANAD